ncbi:mucin-2-like [Anopheles bellator]|uniref:mucin-2-like n=1 Tax=Anopheles bellator TaxID=139047 RepID=UPI0026474B71|nr:mucin-2-like [Anopheles bellator]
MCNVSGGYVMYGAVTRLAGDAPLCTTWKLLTLAATCGLLTLCCLAKPDVSHLLKKQPPAGGDKQKRQNVFEAPQPSGKDGSAGVPFALFPLDENQPSPFRRLEDRPGYNYDKPELPLDVHPDSNLVSPVSTQAPEYLPPADGQETVAVNEVVSPSYPAVSSITPAPITTTTTVGGVAVSSTEPPADGYDYKSPDLPTNINEVVGEPSDINQLATTTEVTTTTTPKASLEYLPPKPRPELVVPRGPEPQPSTTTVASTMIPTETTRVPEPPSVQPDASASVSTVVRPQPTTEVPSTAAPEYLPPDSAGGFQIIVRGRSDADDNEVTVGTTSTSATTEPSTTQQQQQQDEQSSTTTVVSSTTVLDGETATPQADASSVISLINQMQEVNRIAPQDGYGPDEEGSSTTATPSTTTPSVTTNQPTEQPSETPTPPPIESRIAPEEPTVPSLIDLLSSVTTTVAANDTITTYRPADSPATTTTAPIESSADGSEVRPRIAEPDDVGGYKYEMPDNSLDVPTVAPSHTLEADGYHYKVPAVPFPQ